jgi:hypothetical protein
MGREAARGLAPEMLPFGGLTDADGEFGDFAVAALIPAGSGSPPASAESAGQAEAGAGPGSESGGLGTGGPVLPQGPQAARPGSAEPSDLPGFGVAAGAAGFSGSASRPGSAAAGGSDASAEPIASAGPGASGRSAESPGSGVSPASGVSAGPGGPAGSAGSGSPGSDGPAGAAGSGSPGSDGPAGAAGSGSPGSDGPAGAAGWAASVGPAGPAAPGRRAGFTRQAGRADVTVRGFGPGGAELAAYLAAKVRAWHELGRPGVSRLSLRAYPAGTAVQAPSGTMVVDKEHTRLVLGWPGLTGAGPAH